jgi:hypothetical protein
MRPELPPGTSEEEERAILAALELYLGTSKRRLSAWALAGRLEALGLGALQARHQSERPWTEIGLHPYTRRGAEPRAGRSDTH